MARGPNRKRKKKRIIRAWTIYRCGAALGYRVDGRGPASCPCAGPTSGPRHRLPSSAPAVREDVASPVVPRRENAVSCSLVMFWGYFESVYPNPSPVF